MYVLVWWVDHLGLEPPLSHQLLGVYNYCVNTPLPLTILHFWTNGSSYWIIEVGGMSSQGVEYTAILFLGVEIKYQRSEWWTIPVSMLALSRPALVCRNLPPAVNISYWSDVFWILNLPVRCGGSGVILQPAYSAMCSNADLESSNGRKLSNARETDKEIEVERLTTHSTKAMLLRNSFHCIHSEATPRLCFDSI